jgi:hypothetical protein
MASATDTWARSPRVGSEIVGLAVPDQRRGTAHQGAGGIVRGEIRSRPRHLARRVIVRIGLELYRHFQPVLCKAEPMLLVKRSDRPFGLVLTVASSLTVLMGSTHS